MLHVLRSNAMCSLTYLHNIKTTSIMKYVIKMNRAKDALVETNDIKLAEEIAEMLYKKYNGNHVIFVDEKQEETYLRGRFSYDGYKDYDI